jgi:hypothetical protein
VGAVAVGADIAREAVVRRLVGAAA